ncbi:MAG: hypothetical protein ACOYNF_05740 [Rhodoferax sp.]
MHTNYSDQLLSQHLQRILRDFDPAAIELLRQAITCSGSNWLRARC